LRLASGIFTTLAKAVINYLEGGHDGLQETTNDRLSDIQ